MTNGPRFPRTFPRQALDVEPARHRSQPPKLRAPPELIAIPEGRAAAVHESKREQHAEAMVRAAAHGVAPGEVEAVQKLAFNVPKTMHKKLKALAVERETTIRDLVEQALLRTYGITP